MNKVHAIEGKNILVAMTAKDYRGTRRSRSFPIQKG